MRITRLLLVSLLLGGCGVGVSWHHHASFRTIGQGLGLAQIDPGEPVRAAIRTNLDYMTIAVDSVFVRNLPGVGDRHAALGLEIRGILPKGKPLQTVLDVKGATGENGFLSFDNVAVIRPFLYTGQNLTISLHFRAIAKNEVGGVKGRIAGAGDLIKRLDPAVGTGLETASDLFKTIIGAFAKQEQVWRYEFTLFPADSVHRDKPDMLLTATRHVLLILPPASAPSGARKLSADKLMRHLKVRGNRLAWRHNDAAYTWTPYIVLNITRYRRYPAEDTELRKLAKKVDGLIEDENVSGARALLPLLGSAIADDKVITTREKNLERSWKDFREAKLAALAARKKGDAKVEMRQIEKQIQHLHHIRSQFAKILYPYEVKQLSDMVARLAVAARILAQDKGLPQEGVVALVNVYKEAAKRLAEKPPPPPPKRELAKIDLKKDPLPPEPTWRRFYHKWWFWALVSVGIAGAAGTGIGILAQPTPTAPEFPYPDHTLGIPAALRGRR